MNEDDAIRVEGDVDSVHSRKSSSSEEAKLLPPASCNAMQRLPCLLASHLIPFRLSLHSTA